ncbi:MAG: ATP-binding protein [Limisphaerales bacterium]
MKRRRNISRPKKAKINEILTDSSHASGQLHSPDSPNLSKAKQTLRRDLTELRTRFSGMVAQGSVASVVVDSDGYIREVNDAASQLLKYPSSKLKFLSFAHVVTRQDIDLFREHMKRCRENTTSEPVVTELHVMTPEKRVFAVKLTSTAFKRAGGPYYQMAIVDQTPLEQRANELKDALEFSENIFQTIQQPLVVLDERMQVVTINRAFMHTFNTITMVRAKIFVEKLLEARIDGQTIQHQLKTTFSARKTIDGIRIELSPAEDAPFLRRGEKPRTLLISARPFVRRWRGLPLLLVSVEDITRQEMAEAALRREQTMMARAEALAHVAAWEWRIKDDTLIWSDELYKIFGVDKAKFIPTYARYVDLVHPEDRERVDAIVRRGVSTGKPVDFHHRVVRGGDTRILHCQGYFAFDAHGHPAVLMGIAQDVTELRHAEDQLRTLNAELEQRSRSLQTSYEEMQAFSYSIAHDLRAPLRAIQGMSRILLEDYAETLTQDGQDYFWRIMASAQRMDDLIRDLLDYARITTVQLLVGPVDVESVWARVIANYATEIAEKHATVERKQPFPVVSAHRTVVELALNNLLGNALKFFPKGTHPKIKIWTEQVAGNRVRFYVADQGIGIAQEHQERIFRVFERLHPSDAYPGTGIGLAVVKKGIERVGGAVGLISKPGEGSTFWFELPLLDQK